MCQSVSVADQCRQVAKSKLPVRCKSPMVHMSAFPARHGLPETVNSSYSEFVWTVRQVLAITALPVTVSAAAVAGAVTVVSHNRLRLPATRSTRARMPTSPIPPEPGIDVTVTDPQPAGKRLRIAQDSPELPMNTRNLDHRRYRIRSNKRSIDWLNCADVTGS